jgi:uncharacterized protein (DUF4415 family)
MSNRIPDYEEPLDDAIEAEVEEEFRFDPVRAGRNVLPRGVRKVLVTMFLDDDVVAYFKRLADQAPSVSVQTQINQALRDLMTGQDEAVRNKPLVDLFDNPRFVQLLDERISAVVMKQNKKSSPARKRRMA